MNEVVEDAPPLPSNSAKLLTGSSLLKVHINAGNSLPKDGSKDFSPTNTWLEKKQIQSALDERRELLTEERVEKWGCLAEATWDNRRKLATVTRRTGKHFQTLGFEKDNHLYLYPEEALYLLEMNSLELIVAGAPVSIQQGYSLLLGPDTGCTLLEYRAYSHLVRQGYKLLRFTSQKAFSKYERVIRLDQHAPLKRSHPGSITSTTSSTSDVLNSRKVHSTKTVDSAIQGFSLKNESDPVLKEERCNPSKDASDSTLNPKNAGDDSFAVITELEDLTGGSDLNPELSKENANVGESVDSSSVGKALGEKNKNLQKSGRNSPTLNSMEVEQQSIHQSSMTLECEMDGEEYCKGKNDKEEAYAEKNQSPDETNTNSESALSVPEQSSSIEGVETKAYGIAENLLSLGNVLMGKDSVSTNENSSENVSASLKSEIIKVLGSQLKAGVSEEELAKVAESAASTILSHISSVPLPAQEGHENIESEHNCNKGASSDKSVIDSGAFPELEKDCDDSANQNKGDGTQGCATPQTNVEACPANSNLLVCEDTWQDITDINEKNNVQENSKTVKRSATAVDVLPDCEPVVTKRPKVAEAPALDIEILDVVPEKKQVELVDLSDESSIDSSGKGAAQASEGIEVIDVLDSSSEDCSESSNSSSEGDCSVIFEVKEGTNWEIERRRMLETIPNMYNLPEISLVPPSPDLLPTNVQPQHHRYCISRSRLLRESKEALLRPSNYSLQHTGRSAPPFNFDSLEPPSQQVWTPNVPINPMAAVQAIAELVLPMLGIPPEQMWMQKNSWFQPRPMWSSGPRFHQPPFRGNHWQRARPRPYGYRHCSPRFPYHRRGSNNNHHFPLHHRAQSTTVSEVLDHTRNTELVPFDSTSNEVERNKIIQSSGSWHDLKQRSKNRNQKQKRLQRKGLPKGRYFNPSKKQKNVAHMHTLLKEGWDSLGVGNSSTDASNVTHNIKNESGSSEEGSENNVIPHLGVGNSSADTSNVTHNVKSESGSGEEGSENNVIPHLDLMESPDNEKTDESNSSSDGSNNASEVKPLLSPHDCTNFGSVFKVIQVIREADQRVLTSNVSGNRLKPQFDVFCPNKPFKKGNPPVPDFHLCVMSHEDSVPSPGQIQVLSAKLDDGVPILFAVVSPDTVSFLQLGNVSLPCMSV